MKKERSKNLTTSAGIPVDNDQASITTGAVSGYTLMQDAHLTEKLAHFNREKIPERIVHAKGVGAHGYFEVTKDMSKYTKADFLSKIGKKTDLFIRLSTVGGEQGSADSDRDPRGFAIKFYTDEGNYDLVGNNTPIFFIRDAIKFPDFIHTQKRHPVTGLKNADMFWDFLSLTPESLHQVTILFSDRGTPLNHRHMDGHGSHTYMWYNDKNEYVWVKYHFKTDLGWKTMSAAEATKVGGENPDHARRDLVEAIEMKNYPSWTLYVQIMTPEAAMKYQFDPFDVTKVWYKKDFPLQEVGKMVLNRNPEDFFAETEQVAFSPSNFVSGIGPSPDKLLQGRLFSYPDAHRYRLGANSHQIPINAPRCPFATYQKDGSMSSGGPTAGHVYYPNTINGAPTPSLEFSPPAIEVQAVIDRHTRPTEDIDFIQPGVLYDRVLDSDQKTALISNISGHLAGAKKHLQYRQASLCYKASEDYGKRVAEKLKLDIAEVKKLAAMSQDDRVKATLK